MKKLLISTLAFGVLIVPAMAADLGPAPAPYYKAPPPPPPVWSWTGLYIGANAGWIGSTSNTITNTGTDTGTGGLETPCRRALWEACSMPSLVLGPVLISGRFRRAET
jgi:hypothetical protein